jgi:peptidoglycan/xylan/chitin deacetylase (PgdA/CDA1 family)
MVRAGMTIGSHTVTHRRLIDLSDTEVEYELRSSKEAIEKEIGTACEHFCSPVGRPGIDYDPDRAPAIARSLGYRSFLTTQRGSTVRKPEPMCVDRDHTIAIWGRYQLRYFFAK